jgi:hypothetical protein
LDHHYDEHYGGRKVKRVLLFLLLNTACGGPEFTTGTQAEDPLLAKIDPKITNDAGDPSSDDAGMQIHIDSGLAQVVDSSSETIETSVGIDSGIQRVEQDDSGEVSDSGVTFISQCQLLINSWCESLPRCSLTTNLEQCETNTLVSNCPPLYCDSRAPVTNSTFESCNQQLNSLDCDTLPNISACNCLFTGGYVQSQADQ